MLGMQVNARVWPHTPHPFLGCGSGVICGDVCRVDDGVGMSGTGLDSHIALFRQRNSESGNGIQRMEPEGFAWARNRSGKHGICTLSRFGAAEACFDFQGSSRMGWGCIGSLLIGSVISLSLGREVLRVVKGLEAHAAALLVVAHRGMVKSLPETGEVFDGNELEREGLYSLGIQRMGNNTRPVKRAQLFIGGVNNGVEAQAKFGIAPDTSHHLRRGEAL